MVVVLIETMLVIAGGVAVGGKTAILVNFVI